MDSNMPPVDWLRILTRRESNGIKKMDLRNASKDNIQPGDVQQGSTKTRSFFVHGNFNTIDIFPATYKQDVRSLSSLTLEAD